MPRWIEMTRSPEYSPKLIGQELVFLHNDFRELLSDLGNVAYKDKIEKAMLGETIIMGGYLRTELIAANSIVGDKIASNAIVTRHIQADAITADKIAAQSITADKLDVQTLSAISANLGEVTSGSLNIGNGAFKVSSAGKLEATGADISGRVIANSGAIGGWEITDSLIQYRPNSSNNNSRFYLDSGPTGTYRIASYNSSGTRQFSVTRDGVLYARNADISGNITATSGTIGGWNITGSYIDTRDGSARMYLASYADSTSYYIYASDSSGNRMFSVSKTGVLYARNADISGNITSSTITGSTITGGTVRTGSGNNRIELSNNLLRSYSGGVRRVQLDYNSLDFYNSDGSKGGEIIGVYSDIWELPVLMLRSDTGVVETESRISSNNYARIEVVAGHPNIDSPAHVAIEVYQPSVGGLGGMEIGPGGVMTSGFMYVEGDFEVYGQKSAVVETENYGMRKLYAIESPENRFVDIIKVDDLEGKQWVKMNPMFAETISEYEVFHNGDVEILEKQQGKFLVDGSGKVLFLIYGKRKGYEDVYMEEAGCGFEQYHLSRLKRGVINETTSDSGHEQGNSDTETSDRGTHTDKCNSSGED